MDSYQKAISDLSSYLEVRKSEAMVYSLRAEAKEKIGDIVGAVNDYTKAIKFLKREDYYSKAELYYKRALLKFGNGVYNVKDIRKDLDEAIKLKPKNPEIYRMAGVTYAGFNTALKGDPKKLKIRGCSYLSKASEMGSKEAIESIKELCN